MLFRSGRGNRLRIEVGYGLEVVVSDAAAGRILDTYVVPGWNPGQYGTALAGGAVALAQRIAADRGIVLTGVQNPERYSSSQPQDRKGGGFIQLIFFIIIIIAVIRHPWLLLLFMGGGGGRGGGGFGGGSSGGFGGFGGGMSGGGGASR